jgi:hypothetical protein
MAAAFGFFGAPIETAYAGPATPALQAGPGSLGYVAEDGGVQIGALLGVNTAAGSPPGGLQAVGMLGVVALTEFAPAPGVRGWELEIAPGFVPIPHLLAFGMVLNSPPLLVGSCSPRFAGVPPFPPGFARIWLVDGAENPIDPATVMGFGNGNFVSFMVVKAGILQRPT